MRAAWRTCLIAALLLAGCTHGQSDRTTGSLDAPQVSLPPSTASTTPDVSSPSSVVRHGAIPAARAQGGATAVPRRLAESNAPPHAAWFRDPTCRHEWRWWSGLRWTSAVAGDGADGEDPLTGAADGEDPLTGADGEDPLTDADRPAPPAAGWPVDPCEERGIMFTKFPFTAKDLGCVGPDPACVIDERGLPRATRLIAYQELVDSGGYDRGLLQDHAPEGLPEDIVLGYLTECLSEWPSFPHQQLVYGGTPVQTCSMVWRDMAYPITYLGARDDHRCVWDAYKSHYLRGRRPIAPYIHTGWAEGCASWLDPQPHRQVPGDCRLPDRYYNRLTADDRFADYGLSLDDPELSPEAVRRRWCSLLMRCNDLWQQVAPTRYAQFAQTEWPSPCIKRVSGHEINTVRKGRCEELDVLAGLVRAEGESGLPTLPRIPAGLWFSC